MNINNANECEYLGGGNLRTFTRDKNLDIVKGIGILLIILHNYFHTFPEFPPECEFKYAPEMFPVLPRPCCLVIYAL